MNSSKSHARAKAATRAMLSSMSSAPPLPSARASAAACASGSSAPPAADAMQVADLLDAHMDRLHGVRSVLWAMSALLQNASRAEAFPLAARFELQKLARTGLGLASDSVDALSAERCGVAPPPSH
jgi:hypothetical protein